MFFGFVELGDTLYSSVLTKNASLVALNADATPTYRVYGPSGLMANGSGNVDGFKDSGSITGVSGADPAVVTSAGHGLTVGTKVTISGVTGTGNITNANTTAVVTAVTDDTFTLGSVDTTGGTYSSGGTWNVSGLYEMNLSVPSSDGYEVGEVYTVVVSYAISSTAFADTYTFQVS